MCASVSLFDCRQVGVALAEGIHLFPFRTEKLSPPAPMVLPGKPGGRVGRRPFFLRGPGTSSGPHVFGGSPEPAHRLRPGAAPPPPALPSPGHAPWRAAYPEVHLPGTSPLARFYA